MPTFLDRLDKEYAYVLNDLQNGRSSCEVQLRQICESYAHVPLDHFLEESRFEQSRCSLLAGWMVYHLAFACRIPSGPHTPMVAAALLHNLKGASVKDIPRTLSRVGGLSRWPETTLRYISQHRERINGLGQPRGLTIRSLCIQSQVVAISIAWARVATMAGKPTYRDLHQAVDALRPGVIACDWSESLFNSLQNVVTSALPARMTTRPKQIVRVDLDHQVSAPSQIKKSAERTKKEFRVLRQIAKGAGRENRMNRRPRRSPR